MSSALKILCISLILALALPVFPLTVTRPESVPLDPEKVKSAILAKEKRLETIDAEIVIFSYSTGKEIYSLSKKDDLLIKEEQGTIEAMIKIKNVKNPIFIKGHGTDAASLTSSLVDEITKALSSRLP